MGVYKRGNIWWIDFYEHNTRVRRAISPKKSDAIAELERIRTQQREGKFPIIKGASKVRFAEYGEEYLAKYSKGKKSFVSEVASMKALNTFFGNMELKEITEADFAEYRTFRAKQITYKGTHPTNSTINREGALLRHMMKKARKCGYIAYNPIDSLPMVKEEPKERILSYEERGRLLSMASGCLKDMILIALNSGMRKGEILGLEWIQVNLNSLEPEKSFISVKKTKNSKPRIIPTTPSLARLFLRLKVEKGSNENQYVFTNPDTRTRYKDIKKGWNELLKRAGIKDFRFHDLRHMFARRWMEETGDIKTLREILGHSSIAVTGRYLDTPSDYKRESFRLVDIPEETGEIISIKKA